VAERNAGLGTPAEVLRAADEALYRAKEKGRNRLSR
jgi:PleD family two-component response regulator